MQPGTIWSEKAARNVSGMEIIRIVVAIRSRHAEGIRLQNKRHSLQLTAYPSHVPDRDRIRWSMRYPFDGFQLTVLMLRWQG